MIFGPIITIIYQERPEPAEDGEMRYGQYGKNEDAITDNLEKKRV